MLETILLICIMLIISYAGYYIMKKIDKSLYEVELAKYNRYQLKEPSYVIISGDKPLLEIDSSVAKFRENHNNMQIILCSEEIGKKMQEFLASCKIDY